MPRLRSLTIFGEWEPFFISEKLRLLRVLDLEDAEGVTDRSVDQIVKLLPRLKFLSLRGCSDVSCLPDSLGGLLHLQTLDVRNTRVAVLPSTIIKLRKLQYVRAGTIIPSSSDADDGMVVASPAASVDPINTTKEQSEHFRVLRAQVLRAQTCGCNSCTSVSRSTKMASYILEEKFWRRSASSRLHATAS